MPIVSGAVGGAALAAGGAAAGGAGAGIFSGLGSSLLAGGASLLGGFMRNTSSAQQSFQQMAMQDYWLRNRHLIEMEDLYKSGLNPILAVGGQPPVPMGSRAEMGDPVSGAVSSALQARQLDAALDKTAAEVRLLNQEAAESAARESSVKVDTELKRIPLDMSLQGMNYAQRKHFWEEQIAQNEAGKRNFERLSAEAQMYVHQVLQKVQETYGLDRAKAELQELLAKAQHWTSSAFQAYQEGRQSKIDADISELGGGAVRGLERGLRAGAGASSAVRNLRRR